jgi:hypothetical protein
VDNTTKITMGKIIQKIISFFKTLFGKKKLKEIPKDEIKRLTYTKRTN